MECLFRGQRQDTHEWVFGNIYENSDLLSKVEDGSTITKAERSNV